MPRTTRIKQTYISPLGKINALLARIRTDHATPLSDTDHTEVLHILADDRRRYAIEYLTSNPTGMCVPLSDLVDVAAMKNDCLIEEVASIQRERVYVTLYQQHSEPLSEVAQVDTDRIVFTPTAETKRVQQAYTTFQQVLTDQLSVLTNVPQGSFVTGTGENTAIETRGSSRETE